MSAVGADVGLDSSVNAVSNPALLVCYDTLLYVDLPNKAILGEFPHDLIVKYMFCYAKITHDNRVGEVIREKLLDQVVPSSAYFPDQNSALLQDVR